MNRNCRVGLQINKGPTQNQKYYSDLTGSPSSSGLLSSSLGARLAAVISVIERLTSGVPPCTGTAGEPGTGVSGSTLGRCEEGNDDEGLAVQE